MAGAPYMDDPEALGAYILHYWPSSYVQAGRALDRTLAALGRDRAPERVLDIGAGPGPASAAFAARGSREILLADPSQAALALGERLVRAAAGGAGAEALKTGRHRMTAGDGVSFEGGFGAIVFSHSLNELGGAAERLAAVTRYSRLLSPEGFLLLIEPALLSTSRALIGLRDALAERSFGIIGPCVWKGPCPALAAGEAQTCHDESPWRRPPWAAALAGSTGIERDRLKFSWFAVAPPRPDGSKGREGDPLGDSETCLVVSDPMLNKAGRTRYFFCGGEGRFTVSAKLDSLPPACEAFRTLRRGNLVRLGDPERREGGGRGIGASSSLEILQD